MEDIAKTHTKIDFRIKNFQIDNMTNRSFPVILGPRKPYNFRESNFYIHLLLYYRLIPVS